jgi:hypothetical protein
VARLGVSVTLSGGSFANGAKTAAFQELFNNWVHHDEIEEMRTSAWYRSLDSNPDAERWMPNTPLGDHDVYVCRDLAFGNGLGVGANHYWIKTAMYEAGMGTAVAGANAGNQFDLPLSRVETVSHIDPLYGPRSLSPNSECRRAVGAHAGWVNHLIRPGRYLGYFAPPLNYCQTFAREVIFSSGGKWPQFGNGPKGKQPDGK